MFGVLALSADLESPGRSILMTYVHGPLFSMRYSLCISRRLE